MERTLVLVKPDGVKRRLVGEIISFYERKGLLVSNLEMLIPDRALIENHYEEHKGRPYFEELISYLCEDKVVAMVIEGKHAVELVRKINGNKDPLIAESASIRGMYSIDTTKNLVHASDSSEHAEREIEIWFK